jgi:acyl dehydratase
MPTDPAQAGRTFAPTDPVTVTQEHIDAFARCLGAPTGVAAPPTFPFTIAVTAWQRLFDDPDLDIELHRLVHADQRFTARRAMRAGDVVVATATLTSVRPTAGADRLVVDTTLETVAGEQLGVASSTLLCAHPAAPGVQA